MKNILTMSLLLFATSASAESTLKFQEISKDRYLYRFESSTTIVESQAKNLILERAASVCAGATPQLGQFRFKGNESINSDAANAGNSFILEQEVFCVRESQSRQTATPELSVLEESELKKKVTELTRQYFTHLENAEYPRAYQLLADSLKTAPETVWSSQRHELFNLAGHLLDRNIWRVSVYVDPPSAPNKGIYIAADFEQSYENIPIYCGYLVWYQFAQDLRIIREEFGKVESELMKKIKPENITQVKNKMGCKPN